MECGCVLILSSVAMLELGLHDYESTALSLPSSHLLRVVPSLQSVPLHC
jgi:hypothetical protein